MKLSITSLALALTMVASLGAAGCSTAKADPLANAVAPEENPATAPVQAAGTEKDFFFRFYAPVAPPAARVELRGVAPSPRHFWSPGYYRWNGGQHVWVGGSWVLNRPGFSYIAPAWTPRASRWAYVPGHWVRRL